MHPFYIKSITVGEHCNKTLYKTLHHETYKLAQSMGTLCDTGRRILRGLKA